MLLNADDRKISLFSCLRFFILRVQHEKKIFFCSKRYFQWFHCVQRKYFVYMKSSKIDAFYNKKGQLKDNVLGLKSRIGERKGITISQFYQFSAVIVTQDETTSMIQKALKVIKGRSLTSCTFFDF